MATYPLDLTEQADAQLVADRVRTLVDRRYDVDDAEIFMTVSTGIAYTEDPDATPEDLTVILEQLAAIRVGLFGDEARTRELRRRYLALCLDGLRVTSSPLPGQPPTQAELGRRWDPRPN